MISLGFVFVILLFISCFERPRPLDKKVTVIYYLIIAVILALIAASRPVGMPDLRAYTRMFNYPNSQITERIEVGFLALLNFSKYHINNDLWTFLFVSALLSVSLKICGILKLSRFIWTSLLVYVSSKFILQDMIQMRVAVSSGLLLLAIYYKYQKDLVRYVITCVLAYLFHYSALVILPIWFLSSTKINKWVYIAIIPISYAFGFIGVQLAKFIQYIPIAGIQNLLEHYTVEQSLDGANLFSILYLTKALLCLFFLFYAEKFAKESPYFILLIKIYTISIMVFALFFSINVVSVRVSELFQIVEIVLIPMLYYMSKHRFIGKCAIAAICLIYFNFYVFFSGYFPNT